MIDVEKRRAKERRKDARRRARKLGLPIPEFANTLPNSGRPPNPENAGLTENEKVTRHARLRGVRPLADVLEEKRIKREVREAERQAEREAREVARALWALGARERRLEVYRQNSKRYRALNPDKKREQDRAYRAANREKVNAASKRRKAVAVARGYRYKPTPEYLERQRERSIEANLEVTAACQYLRSIGLMEWWGPQETTKERRAAALVFVRQLGIAP